jgi:hypothetical protein
MDRKELYQNVRKAYRLAYEVQDSIIAIVEHIRTKIRYSEIAGKQLFSASIEKHIPALDYYADQKYLGYQWSWDYFPTYMYLYYFSGIPTETKYSCFSIVQVMDDGFIKLLDKNTSPSTKDFLEIADSESYLLINYSSCDKRHRATWFDYDGKNQIDDIRKEIVRINEIIKGNGTNTYVEGDGGDIFIVKRISLEAIGSKEEADRVLHDFAKLVLDKTGYQLLLEEPKE